MAARVDRARRRCSTAGSFSSTALPGRSRRGKARPPRVGHIRFARTRFPDDPHFQMAEAIGAERSATHPLDRLSAPLAQSTDGVGPYRRRPTRGRRTAVGRAHGRPRASRGPFRAPRDRMRRSPRRRTFGWATSGCVQGQSDAALAHLRPGSLADRGRLLALPRSPVHGLDPGLAGPHRGGGDGISVGLATGPSRAVGHLAARGAPGEERSARRGRSCRRGVSGRPMSRLPIRGATTSSATPPSIRGWCVSSGRRFR